MSLETKAIQFTIFFFSPEAFQLLLILHPCQQTQPRRHNNHILICMELLAIIFLSKEIKLTVLVLRNIFLHYCLTSWFMFWLLIIFRCWKVSEKLEKYLNYRKQAMLKLDTNQNVSRELWIQNGETKYEGGCFRNRGKHSLMHSCGSWGV